MVYRIGKSILVGGDYCEYIIEVRLPVKQAEEKQ